MANDKKIKEELKKIKNEVMDKEMAIYVPTEKQIIAKAQIWAKSKNDGKDVRDYSKYTDLPELSDFGKSTWQKWFAKEGFEAWLYDPEDFQNWVDERSSTMARRLFELAMKERGNAAVSACKAFLELSSYKKQRIEMSDEFSEMSDNELREELRQMRHALAGNVIEIGENNGDSSSDSGDDSAAVEA